MKKFSISKTLSMGVVAALLVAGSGQAAMAAEAPSHIENDTTSNQAFSPDSVPNYRVDFVTDNSKNSLKLTLSGSTAIKRATGEVDLIRNGTSEVLETLPLYIDSGVQLGRFKAEYSISESGEVVTVALPEITNDALSSTKSRPSMMAQARGNYDQVCVRNGVLVSMGTGALWGIGAGLPGVVVGSLVGALQAGVTAIALCKK